MSKRKEAYVKTLENSAICWHKEWEKSEAKRVEIEEKYERLTRKIKENAFKEIVEAKVGLPMLAILGIKIAQADVKDEIQEPKSECVCIDEFAEIPKEVWEKFDDGIKYDVIKHETGYVTVYATKDDAIFEKLLHPAEVTEENIQVAKYQAKDDLKEFLNKAKAKYEAEFGKLHKVDFGAGPIDVQHKMKDLDDYMNNLDKLDL